MPRPHGFLRTHLRTLTALAFGLAFSITVTYAIPPTTPYTPAETLDPSCAPGDTNCTVKLLTLQTNSTDNGNQHVLNLVGGTNITLTDNGSGNVTVDADNETDPLSWSLTGNAGTTSANFIGTTDNVPLRFKVNNEPNGFIDSDAVTLGNTAFGYHSLFSNTTGSLNVAIGNAALPLNTTGVQNTAVVAKALPINTTSSYNVAIGSNTLSLETTGNYNVAVGSYALGTQNAVTGSVAVGYAALFANTAPFNTAIGNNALRYNTSGQENVALGYWTMLNNTTGNQNTAFGTTAMRYNTTGSQNVALGRYSLWSNSTGSQNVAIGYQAAQFALGSGGVYIGSQAGISATGDNKLYIANSGTATPLIYGDFATPSLVINGGGAADVASAIFNVVSTTKGFLAPRMTTTQRDAITSPATGLQVYNTTLNSNDTFDGTDWMSFGKTTYGGTTANGDMTIDATSNATKTTSYLNLQPTGGFVGIHNTTPGYTLHVGDSSIAGIVARFQNSTGTCDINPTSSSLSCSSDETLKKNISPLGNNTLEKILELRPVTYNWNEEEKDSTHIGFIAQDVEEIFPDLVATDPDTDLKSLNYGGLIPYAIKAIQEMEVKITSLDDLDEENTWREALMNWFGNVGNGIEKLFAGEIVTKKLCVSDDSGEKTCLTKSQLDSLIEQSDHDVIIISPEPTPDTTPDDTPDEVPDVPTPETPDVPPADTPPAPPETPEVSEEEPEAESVVETTSETSEVPAQ